MTREQRNARGYAAKALLTDPTLKHAWEQLETELREQWEACWLPRKRDRIWHELRHLKALREKLVGFAAHADE